MDKNMNFDLTNLSDMLLDNSSLKVRNLPLTAIEVDQEQVRKAFNEGFNDDNITDLANSIKEIGVQQPIIVKKEKEGEKYKIICGERRYRASQLAALETIPAIIVKPDLTEEQILVIQLTENVQRVDLEVLEIADAVKNLLNLGYAKKDVAKKIGKDPTFISMLQPFFDLEPKFRAYFEMGKITKSIRTSYELCQLYQKHPDLVLNYLNNLDEDDQFTRADIKELKNLIKNKILDANNEDSSINVVKEIPVDKATNITEQTVNHEEQEQLNHVEEEEEKELAENLYEDQEITNEQEDHTSEPEITENKIENINEQVFDTDTTSLKQTSKTVFKNLLVLYDGYEYIWDIQEQPLDEFTVSIKAKNSNSNVSISVPVSELKIIKWID